MSVSIRFLRAVAGAALLAAVPLAAQDSAAAAGSTPVRTSADSSFSDEQAERGAKVFVRTCVECHERLEFSNDDFRLKWGGQTTFDLFKNIYTTMPDSDPGSLPRGDYVDVVAYILKLNGVPAGRMELADDSTVMGAAKLRLPLSTSKGASAASSAAAPANHRTGAAASDGRERPGGAARGRLSSLRIEG